MKYKHLLKNWTDINVKLNTSQYQQQKKKEHIYILRKDYNKELYKDEHGHYYINGSKKPLISQSRLLKGFNEYNFFGIYPPIMEKAKKRGSQLMENLEYCFKNKIEDYKKLNLLSEFLEPLKNVMEFLKKHNFKILAIEKVIHNGICMGIVDMVVSHKGKIYIVEIKTRKEAKIKFNDIFQMTYYYRLFAKATPLLLIVDANNKVHLFKFEANNFKKDFNQIIKSLNNFLFLDLETPAT